MQRKWTIEVIADLTDNDDNEAFDDAVRRKAVELQATVMLLSPAAKPQTSAYSDDFFYGRKDIDIMLRTRAAELKTAVEEPQEEVSDELLSALRDMGKR